MSDNDLIRRGDALDAMCKGPRTVQERIDSLRAIPAATPTLADALALPEVRALVEADQGFLQLVADAVAEASKAMRKFPQPNYVLTKFAEESGEVVKAAIHYIEGRETVENVRGEMKQTIAMLYRLWVEGDQVHGLAAIKGGA